MIIRYAVGEEHKIREKKINLYIRKSANEMSRLCDTLCE